MKATSAKMVINTAGFYRLDDVNIMQQAVQNHLKKMTASHILTSEVPSIPESLEERDVNLPAP